jgi:hypothetical protein
MLPSVPRKKMLHRIGFQSVPVIGLLASSASGQGHIPSALHPAIIRSA